MKVIWAFLFSIQSTLNFCLLATLFVINEGLVYNRNQLSVSLGKDAFFFILIPTQSFLLFLISHSCQKSILSLHEVKFPLAAIMVAGVRCPVSNAKRKHWEPLLSMEIVCLAGNQEHYTKRP